MIGWQQGAATWHIQNMAGGEDGPEFK